MTKNRHKASSFHSTYFNTPVLGTWNMVSQKFCFFFHFSSQTQKMPMVHTGFPIHHHSIVRLTPVNPGLQKRGLLASTFGWLYHGMAHLKIYKFLAIRKAFVHESKAPNKVPKVGLGIFNENPCGLSYSSLPEYRHFCIP